MKKSKLILILVALFFLINCLYACNNVTKKKNNEDEVTLNLTLYAAGYGTQWIEEASRIFKKDNPNVNIQFVANSLAIDSAKTQLENDNCSSDIVIVHATDYSRFVTKGYIEDLTDLYNTKVADSEFFLKDIILPQVLSSKTINGHIYGIPWQANNASGIMYNKKMFNKYNWKIPNTMDEFWNLCDQISIDTENKVSPMVYGGADGFGYLPNNFVQWLAEYYGYDNMIKFLQLSSPSVFENQKEGREKIYQTIAKLTKGKTKNGEDICLDGSSGSTAMTAQTNFMNEMAAMIPSGQYFMNEMQEYINLKNFDVGYLPMPHINSDEKSGDKKIDTSFIRISTDNGVFAIPSSSSNKEIAKKFLLSMFTSESYTSFVKTNNGLTRPIKNVKVDDTNFNNFTKSSFEYFEKGNQADQTLYIISKNNIIESHSLPIFLAYDGNFFPNITNSKNFESALKVANECYQNEIQKVWAKWDSVNKTF